MPISVVEARYRDEERTMAMSKKRSGCKERSIMIKGLVSYV
jgi:hypothetical protein